jgi:phospho-N-acetylmuramoyl-pentapeptide-transferase
MLYHFLYPLGESIGLFNIFRYITFRSFLALVLAIIISLIWGKFFIVFMQKKQFGQVIRELGPESHQKKKGTPTAGGIFMIGAIIISTFICGNYLSGTFLIGLFVLLSYFVLGFFDDYQKILKKNTKGVSARGKLFWQFMTALIAMFALVHFNLIDTKLYVPFLKTPLLDLGWAYLLFGSLVIVGSSNAVNLTDGLDGLAIGPIMTSAGSLGLIAYLTGHNELSHYLLIPHVESAGELLILCAAIVGAGAGFLWYNAYPAQVFMGDVGSLSLGGVLGLMAVATKSELLYVIIGGVFVVEALSVILQVGSFKLRGKRVFKMAPIHHHFELSNWPETKVIVRFWIISALLAIIAISTLKIR